MDNEKNIINDQKHIPWYFGRKFWGIIIALSALPGLMLSWILTTNIRNVFLYLASASHTILSLLNIKITILYYIILYYIILGLLFYLTFRKKKVNIIFPIIIIIIIIISTVMLLSARGM